MRSFCYHYYLVLSACPILHYHISTSEPGQLSAVALHHSKAQVAATAGLERVRCAVAGRWGPVVLLVLRGCCCPAVDCSHSSVVSERGRDTAVHQQRGMVTLLPL